MAITREISGGVYSGELPFPVREKRGNGGGDGADRWVPPVGEGKRGREYRFGIGLGGLRAASGAGLNGFPGALFLFLFSFASFLFLFSFSFVSFAKGFNSIQTTFRNFLKFKIIIQNSNKQVFIIKTTFYKNHMKWPKVFICIMQIEIGFE
jgi:hypothetical protein